MLRRREMVGLDGEPIDAPLYPSWKGNYSPSNAKWTVDGAEISATTSANSRNLYFHQSNRSTSNANFLANTWFTIPAGKSFSIAMTDFEYTGNSSSANYVIVYFQDKSGATQIYARAGGTTTATIPTGDGTKADYINTYEPLESDTPISCVRILVYRAITFTFKLRVEVDGVWYAI